MSESTEAANRPADVKVTAHVMPLDPGLYCVGHLPGATAPDLVSGLPGVRVSPGPGRYAGQVTICGFSADGWIGHKDDAMLVRIVGAPANVMITIYQAANAVTLPPKLQVLKLSSDVPVAADARSHADVLAHVYGIGDVGGGLGQWIGERGGKRWIEGFALSQETVAAGDLEYQAVLGRSWMSPWAEGGQFCGSRFMSLPILGLCVRLRGKAAEMYRLCVSATFVDGSAIGPVEGGQPCQSDSLAALEAFRIEITPREPAAAKRRGRR